MGSSSSIIFPLFKPHLSLFPPLINCSIISKITKFKAVVASTLSLMGSDSHYYYQAPLNGPITYGSINTCNRNTHYCSNIALIQSDKEKYGDLCQHSHGIGWKSAHNCVTGSGKSYLCVQCGVAHCLVSDLAFLRKNKIADRNAQDCQASETAGIRRWRMLHLMLLVTWNRIYFPRRVRSRLSFFSKSPTLAHWMKSRTIPERCVTTSIGMANATRPITRYSMQCCFSFIKPHATGRRMDFDFAW